MGFTTGLLSGLALVTSTTYLSLLVHQQSRAAQRLTVQQSTILLTGVTSPAPPTPPPSEQVEPAGLLEMAKDRWNGDVQRLMRGVQGTDWNGVREQAEDIGAGVWKGIRREVRRMSEGGRAEEIKERLKDEAKQAEDLASGKVKRKVVFTT